MLELRELKECQVVPCSRKLIFSWLWKLIENLFFFCTHYLTEFRPTIVVEKSALLPLVVVVALAVAITWTGRCTIAISVWPSKAAQGQQGQEEEGQQDAVVNKVCSVEREVVGTPWGEHRSALGGLVGKINVWGTHKGHEKGHEDQN